MPRNRETRTAANPALLAVGQRPDVLAWKQPVGVFRQYEAPHTPVRVGNPGQADAIAVVAVTITPEMVGRTVGVAVAAEFKAGRGRQSPAQEAWQRAFEQRGGVYRVVRGADDMLELVSDVQSGRW